MGWACLGSAGQQKGQYSGCWGHVWYSVLSSLEVISSICLLEHITVQGCPRSELLFFDVFLEREKRKQALFPFLQRWLGASH